MDNQISLGQIDDSVSSERRDAAANRIRILAAAKALFAEHGVAAVNMADIAIAAGVGKGTLYRRFANKGELCYAFLDEHLAEFQNRMLAEMRRMTVEGASAMAQLDYFLNALVYFTDEHMPLLCEVQQAGGLLEFGEVGMPHFWQRMAIGGLLRSGLTAGELAPDLDIDYVADALLAPLNAQFFRFQRERRGFSLERISAGLRSFAEGLILNK